MKFTVTFKTPDVLEGLQEQAQNYIDNTSDEQDEEMLIELTEQLYETMNELASKWVKYSEYVIIEFDTEANTATVLKARS